MRFGKTNNSKSNRKLYGIGTVVALLVIVTLLVTSLSSTFFMSAAIAADLYIDMTPGGSGSTPDGTLANQYETVYTTAEEVELLQLSIFKDEYENTQQQITVAGVNGEKVIAPGTENSYKFAVINTYGGYLDYKITVDSQVKGLENYPDKKLPVEVRLKGTQGWMLGSDEGTDTEQWQPIATLDSLEDMAVLRGRGNAVYTLDWRWQFEQDNVAEGDALDTWLGTHDEPITLTITIVTQAAYHYPSSDRPAILAPVPGILEKEIHMPYVGGYGDGTIRPNANITRAEVAAILCKIIREEEIVPYITDEHPYNDIPEDAWYRTSVATLTNMELFSGYPDGSFGGDRPITRAELGAVYARISVRDNTGVDTSVKEKYKTNFNDIKDHWAENDIKLIESFNWIIGYGDGTFRPNRPITRAETIAVTNRVLHRTPELYENLLPIVTFTDNMDETKWYYIDIQEASNGHDYVRLLGTRERWIKVWEDNTGSKLFE